MKINFWAYIKSLTIDKWAILLILGFVLLGTFRNYIANDIPLYSHINGSHYFPILSKDMKTMGLSSAYATYKQQLAIGASEWSIMPIIPYHSTTIDPNNIHFVSPLNHQNVSSLRYRHFLGTDQIGRDVLAGIIHGCAIALKVAIGATTIAVIIGLLLGLLAGFYQDNKWKMNILSILFWIIGLFLLGFYIIYNNSYQLINGTPFIWGKMVFSSILGLSTILFIDRRILQRLSIKRFSIPLDLIIMRMVESLNAIPLILIIFAVLAMFEKSTITHVIWIIGLTRWTTITRYIRAEVLHIRAQNYITAAIATGLTDQKIIWNHTLPNAISPIIITIAFSMASAIGLEATLSFLGIGIPADVVSWGSIIQSARSATNAWWVAVFPGIAIFLLILALNKIGEAVSK